MARSAADIQRIAELERRLLEALAELQTRPATWVVYDVAQSFRAALESAAPEQRLDLLARGIPDTICVRCGSDTPRGSAICHCDNDE